MMRYLKSVLFAVSALTSLSCITGNAQAERSEQLFAKPGRPAGWVVRAWDDVSKVAPSEASWIVDGDGVLHGSEPRGTWLVSEKQYGDFVLDFEWKLGERGNSGCGVRFPES